MKEEFFFLLDQISMLFLCENCKKQFVLSMFEEYKSVKFQSSCGTTPLELVDWG